MNKTDLLTLLVIVFLLGVSQVFGQDNGDTESSISLKKEQPTLFDFSSLHAKMHEEKLNVSEQLEDFLWAFDAAIFIPNASPTEPIISPVN